jgi:hypothetical protein
VVNCGFDADKGECSGEKVKTLPVVSNQSENEGVWYCL